MKNISNILNFPSTSSSHAGIPQRDSLNLNAPYALLLISSPLHASPGYVIHVVSNIPESDPRIL